MESGREGGLGLKEAVSSILAAGVVWAWWRGGGFVDVVGGGAAADAVDDAVDDVAV